MFASDAAARRFHFARARSFARYQDLLVRAIVLLKFAEMEPLADWFADRLPEVVHQNGKAREADLVVPVPAAQGSAVRARIQPGGIAVRTIGQAAQAPASKHFISEKAA
jgi:predicted amidophosphoribosyltransferase